MYNKKYYGKYLKYKNKYLNLKQLGGNDYDINIITNNLNDETKNVIIQLLLQLLIEYKHINKFIEEFEQLEQFEQFEQLENDFFDLYKIISIFSKEYDNLSIRTKVNSYDIEKIIILIYNYADDNIKEIINNYDKFLFDNQNLINNLLDNQNVNLELDEQKIRNIYGELYNEIFLNTSVIAEDFYNKEYSKLNEEEKEIYIETINIFREETFNNLFSSIIELLPKNILLKSSDFIKEIIKEIILDYDLLNYIYDINDTKYEIKSKSFFNELVNKYVVKYNNFFLSFYDTRNYSINFLLNLLIDEENVNEDYIVYVNKDDIIIGHIFLLKYNRDSDKKMMDEQEEQEQELIEEDIYEAIGIQSSLNCLLNRELECRVSQKIFNFIGNQREISIKTLYAFAWEKMSKILVKHYNFITVKNIDNYNYKINYNNQEIDIDYNMLEEYDIDENIKEILYKYQNIIKQSDYYIFTIKEFS